MIYGAVIPWAPFVEFRVVPVIEIEKSFPIAKAAIAQRESLKNQEVPMRIVTTTLLAGALLSLLPLPSPAQSDWVDIKDPQALRGLFSNKTHRSRAYVAHFRADGEGVLISTGSDVRHARKWQVKGTNQVCVGPKDGAPTCYRYQRSSKNPAEVLATGELNGQRVMLWFTVEDGIPKF